MHVRLTCLYAAKSLTNVTHKSDGRYTTVKKGEKIYFFKNNYASSACIQCSTLHDIVTQLSVFSPIESIYCEVLGHDCYTVFSQSLHNRLAFEKNRSF